MYHTTGFAKDEIIDLCALVYANEENPATSIRGRRPSVFIKSVVIALTYMRRNRVQQELAETYKTSQPTISRANSRITSRLAIVLAPFVPTAEDLDPDAQYIYDGTLLPCWSCRDTGSCIQASAKPPVRTSRLRAIFTGSSHGYPARLNEKSGHDAHCIDEYHQCLPGSPTEARSAIKDTSAGG